MLLQLVCQGKHYSINLKGKYPFSIQAGDPKIIANECGIDVVSDFRNDHIKLGGEGAPLVPEFHQKLFAKKNTPLVILNIGGISNFTYLDEKSNFSGSDCGPGNALMDIYCQNFSIFLLIEMVSMQKMVLFILIH